MSPQSDACNRNSPERALLTIPRKYAAGIRTGDGEGEPQATEPQVAEP